MPLPRMHLVFCFILVTGQYVNVEAGPDSNTNDQIISQCGGVVTQVSGVIWYKPFEPLSSFEVCTWTLSKSQGQTLQLGLLHDGFVESDYPTNPVLVQIIYITDSGIIANYPNITELKPGDRQKYNFSEENTNVFLVRFVAYGSNGTGEGFILRFKISGNSKPQARGPNEVILYKNFHSSEFNGFMEYFPRKGANELITYVADPQVPFIMFTYFLNITVPGKCPDGPDSFTMVALTGSTSLRRNFCDAKINSTTLRLGTRRNPHVIIYRSALTNWKIGNGFAFNWTRVC